MQPHACQEGPLMPRPKTGSVFEKPWADGETISHGAYVYAYGRREKVTFGTNKQGWNRTRAELETEKILQQIERGTWVPPRLEPREDRLEEAMAQLGVQIDETFRVFAKRWWRVEAARPRREHGQRLRVAARLPAAVLRPLPAARDHDRGSLTGSATSCTSRRRRSAARRSAHARDKGARPLMETVTDKRGRTYQRRRRPLSNTSINAMIKLLGQILQQAVDYELIDRNPVRVGGALGAVPPAGAADADVPRDRRVPRAARRRRRARGRGAVGSQGPRPPRDVRDARARRASGSARCSTCASRQVDLARSRFKLAGREDGGRGPRGRDDALPARRAARVRDGPPRARAAAAGRQITSSAPRAGKRRDPDRFRDRILVRAVERANANRAQARAAAAAARSRRTRCDAPGRRSPRSIGRDPKWIAAQIGHTDPAVHVLGLPAGRHPSLHRRAGDLDRDAVRRRAGRARAQPADHPRRAETIRAGRSRFEKGEFDRVARGPQRPEQGSGSRTIQAGE